MAAAMVATFAELLETMRGYRSSRILLTAVELDVFTAIGKGATASAAAARLAADPRAAEALLGALVALGALTKRGNKFFNTAETARYLVSSSPECVRAGLLHTVNRWDTWSTLSECVRIGTCVLDPDIEKQEGEWSRAFISSMHQNAAGKAAKVAGAVSLAGVRRALDVGGGSGAYSIALAQASGSLQIEILDQPSVAPLARQYIRAAGLEDRIQVRTGDLCRDDLGTGYDLILLSAICHLFSAAENQDLFRRCHRALAVRGRLVIRDHILDSDRTGPLPAALFALHMLVATRAGSSYSLKEYRSWLTGAGFRQVRRAAGTQDVIIAMKGGATKGSE